MTREEASEVITIIRGEVRPAAQTEEEKTAADVCIEALDLAISALRGPTREQVEKMRGEWIGNYNTDCSRCDAFSTMAFMGKGGNFCPNCGAPMTDEAVDLLAKRLEELNADRDT